jgi:hypothetical protein
MSETVRCRSSMWIHLLMFQFGLSMFLAQNSVSVWTFVKIVFFWEVMLGYEMAKFLLAQGWK